jgi:hypothetical protein
MVKPQSMHVDESYEIKLKGHLDESWADWFDGLTFTHESDGTTTLRGEIIDQAALHGLLKKIRDLGMPLLSVNRVESKQNDASGETNG